MILIIDFWLPPALNSVSWLIDTLLGLPVLEASPSGTLLQNF